MWNNEITRQLGIKLPFVGAGMAIVGSPELTQRRCRTRAASACFASDLARQRCWPTELTAFVC